MSERPRSDRPRRLADWLNPTDEKKVHSLVDKVYKRKNLVLAWEKVKRNQGSGGIDGENLATFEELLDERLDRLHGELKSDTYRPKPVRQHRIPKAGQPGKWGCVPLVVDFQRTFRVDELISNSNQSITTSAVVSP